MFVPLEGLSDSEVIELANSEKVHDRRKAARCRNVPFDLRCKLYDDPDEIIHRTCLYYFSCKQYVLYRAYTFVFEKYAEMGVYDVYKLMSFFSNHVWDNYIRGINMPDWSQPYPNGAEMLSDFRKWVQDINAIAAEGIAQGKLVG